MGVGYALFDSFLVCKIDMFLQFKQPLRRICFKPWYNHSLILTKPTCISLVRSYTALQTIDIYQKDLGSKLHTSRELITIPEQSMVLAEGFVKRDEVDQGLRCLQDSNCKEMDSYAVLMESLLQRGKYKECISVYDKLLQSFKRNQVDTNRRIVKCMLTAHFSQDHMDICDKYLQSQLQFKFTRNTIFRILNVLMGIEDKHGLGIVPGYIVVKAFKVMESRLHIYLNAEGVCRIITQLGDRGDCKEAYNLYNWVRSNGHQVSRDRCGRTRIYKAMMYSAIKNNKPRILERAWVDMQYRKQYYGRKYPKRTNTLSSFNLLLNGFASTLPRPDLRGLQKAYKQMLTLGLHPERGTYNILIKAFVNADNMDGAKQIYQKMIDSNIKPDAQTINTMLHGWVVKRNWKQIEAFLQDSRKQSKKNLDIVTFNILVKSFLQLNTRSLPYEQLLKRKRHWKALNDWKDKQPKTNMTSVDIWSIFETTTGYSKDLETNTSRNSKAFIRLFSKKAEPNHITFKLFMMAFVNIGDHESAARIRQWMIDSSL